MGELQCPQVAAVPLPRELVVAKRRVVRGPSDRSTGCPQKQSPPYIRRVQYTVLSVAGLKGTMSEFELNLLRQRSVEAIRQKARRGELRYCLPAGYLWTNDGTIDKDPDQRVQQALGVVFLKMTELGSVRQVLLWFRRERAELPAKDVDDPAKLRWALPVYNTVHKILTNPMFAGA